MHLDGWSGKWEIFRELDGAVVLTPGVRCFRRTSDDVGPNEDVVLTGVGFDVRDGGSLNVFVVAGETYDVDWCSHFTSKGLFGS